MPYIKQEKRGKIDDIINQLNLDTEGELNYAITTLVINWVRSKSRFPKFTYEIGNAAMGVLESAKLEFYRRVMVPYEDRKIKDNGDVYSGSLRRGE